MLIVAVSPGQTLFGAAFLLGPRRSFPILVSNLRPERVPEGQAGCARRRSPRLESGLRTHPQRIFIPTSRGSAPALGEPLRSFPQLIQLSPTADSSIGHPHSGGDPGVGGG
jgi:hypothetical protein